MTVKMYREDEMKKVLKRKKERVKGVGKRGVLLVLTHQQHS